MNGEGRVEIKIYYLAITNKIMTTRHLGKKHIGH